MKKILILFLLLPVSIFAQTEENNSANWKADLTLSGFYQAGNVETLIFRANSNTSFKLFQNSVFETKNSYVYQEFGKTKADEDILSLNFLNFNPNRKFYPLALAFISTNFRREIDLRYLFGLGFSYKVLDEGNNSLNLSLSTEFEHTEFGRSNFNRSQYDGETIINTYRGTIWVNGSYELIKDKMIIRHESFYKPSLERDSNFRWQADTKIELPILTYLNVTISYLYTFENVVISGQKPEDRFFTLGFTLKSY
jgi:hypothetical protein